MRARLLALCIAASVPLASTAARADEASASDVDAARSAFREGLELRDKGHDLSGAIDRFKTAYALVPTPRIAFELGKTYRMAGDLVAARKAFLDGTRLPSRQGESAEARKARDESRKQASELEEKIPTLRFRLKGDAHARVAVDGNEVPDLGRPVALNPGHHVVTVEVGAYPPKTLEADLAEGDRRELAVSLPQADSGGGGFQVGSTVDVAPSRNNPLHTGLLITAGVGLLAGTITGLAALGVAESASKLCTGTEPKICGPGFQSKKDEAMALAWGANIAFGVAIVSTVLWLAIPPLGRGAGDEAKGGTTVRLAGMPGGGMLSVQGGF
jgi:hypothetical protein